ncbi:hypothetical protein D3C81_914640 [compost metagenome]
MIFVNRANVVEPAILLNNNADPNGEKQKAIDYFESNIGKPVKFSIYKDDSVRTTLKRLFQNKCAYCESMITHISYPHIEHWRPKAKVTEDNNHVGYYWLASEWDNLLLACGVCNGSANKGNKFPVVRGSSYAYRSMDPLVNEQPLLINPCNEDPTSHLTYRSTGAIRGVTPKGRKSIDVYGLNRQDLIIERKKIAKIVLGYLDDIEGFIADTREALANGQSRSVLMKKKRKVTKKVEDLKEFCCNNFQYSAMVSYLVDSYRQSRQNDLDFITATQALV